LQKLASALAPFHPRLRDLPPELPFVWDEATLRNRTIFTLRTDLGTIDLLAEVAGVGTYEEASANAVMADAFGRRVALLDLPTLINSKRAAGRPQDLLDIAVLESILEATEPDPE
jgi:hypothetical protein